MRDLEIHLNMDIVNFWVFFELLLSIYYLPKVRVRVLILSRKVGYQFFSLNEQSEKFRVTIILCNFVSKPKSKSYWLRVFEKLLSFVKN